MNHTSNILTSVSKCGIGKGFDPHFPLIYGNNRWNPNVIEGLLTSCLIGIGMIKWLSAVEK